VLREKGLRSGRAAARASPPRLLAPEARDRAARARRYLAEIAETVRGYHRRADEQARIARERQQLRGARAMLLDRGKPAAALDALIASASALATRARASCSRCGPGARELYAGDEYVVKIRDREIRTALTHSRCPARDPKVALPRFEDDGELLRG
jgi:isobutyryl-CoA mutase